MVFWGGVSGEYEIPLPDMYIWAELEFGRYEYAADLMIAYARLCVITRSNECLAVSFYNQFTEGMPHENEQS